MVQYDLVICLFYRVSNLSIIVYKSGLVSTCTASIALAFRKACFRVFGALSGQRIVNVTDVEVATAVLRSSEVKGDALERHIATPAWRPLLSLESVDGSLYKSMLGDFHKVMKVLPPSSQLKVIAKTRLQELVNEATTIDAQSIARLSLTVFIEYVFGRTWEDSFEPLIEATWEWRKEIAVRGKASASSKLQAVNIVVELLKSHPTLWALYGEKWREPRYYSLILQPFIVSPAINVGDIAVALKLNPDLNLEDAMRDMHPFPIFERFVKRDVKGAFMLH